MYLRSGLATGITILGLAVIITCVFYIYNFSENSHPTKTNTVTTVENKTRATDTLDENHNKTMHDIKILFVFMLVAIMIVIIIIKTIDYIDLNVFFLVCLDNVRFKYIYYISKDKYNLFNKLNNTDICIHNIKFNKNTIKNIHLYDINSLSIDDLTSICKNNNISDLQHVILFKKINSKII